MNSKNIEKRYDLIRMLLAIALAMGLVLLLIVLVSSKPLEAMGYFLTGPLKNTRRFFNVIEAAIPLVFTGLAVSMLFLSLIHIEMCIRDRTTTTSHSRVSALTMLTESIIVRARRRAKSFFIRVSSFLFCVLLQPSVNRPIGYVMQSDRFIIQLRNRKGKCDM